MISISPKLLFTIGISLIVLVGIGLWIHQIWLTLSRNWEVSEDQICHCSECQTPFLVKPRVTDVQCPACGINQIIVLSRILIFKPVKNLKHLNY